MGRNGKERLIFRGELDKKEAGNDVAGLAQGFLPWISAESSGLIIRGSIAALPQQGVSDAFGRESVVNFICCAVISLERVFWISIHSFLRVCCKGHELQGPIQLPYLCFPSITAPFLRGVDYTAVQVF